VVTLFLPFPPSVNEAYGNNKSGRGKGRYKTSKYKAWLKEADAVCLQQKAERTVGTPIVGPYECHMTFSRDRRRWNSDLSNRIKVAEDYLKRAELIEDDSKCESLNVVWGPVEGVFIRAFRFVDMSPGTELKTICNWAGS
jgi:Holliday junction resolvase RusA-like endonuclease